MRRVLEAVRTPWGQSAGLIAALLAVTSLPYVYARLSAPADLVYTGLMFDVPDHAQYWSWVTASRHALFISNTMTPEPNAPIFMNPMMWLLSRAQIAFGLSFPALFQWWRVATIIMLVPLLLVFVRVMMPERDRRATALLITLLGSGFGWVWVMIKRWSAAADVRWPQDLYTVEPNTFWAMLSYPFISLAHALILATMLGAWLAHRGKGWPAYLLAVGGAASLSLSHTYDLITVYVVLAAYGLFEWIRRRQLPVRLAAAGMMIVAASAPAALYYQQLTTGDPLWRSILSQYSNAGVWTPRHFHLIVLMGAPLLLALVGLNPRDGWTDERRFVTIWAATGLCLIYLPVVYQIKLLSAWQFPIAVLAAHAWHERMAPVLERRTSRRWAVAALVVTVSLTNVYLFAWRFIDLGRHAPPYYLHDDEVEALAWLSRNAQSSDVVLAPAEIGQFVPNYGASRAYLAHWAMTNRFYERRANVERFFAADTPERWREQLVTSEKVTLVLRSGWPPALDATYDPGKSSAFELLFSRPRAQVYRVRAAAPAARALGASRQ